MTKLKVILLFIASSLICACNNSGSKKVKELLKVGNVYTQDDYKSGKWLEDLPSKTPLTFNELENLLPKSLLGKPLVKVIDLSRDGMSSIKGQYSLDKELTKESVEVNFFIIDGAGNEGQTHLKATFNTHKYPINKDDGINILKITDWGNKSLLVRQRQVKEKWVSNLEFIKNLRFHVKIEGKKLNLEEIKALANVLEQLNFPD